MILTHNDKKELLSIAIFAAKKAGSYIRNFPRKDLHIKIKSDAPSLASEVLTEVDTKSQEIILKELSASIIKYNFGLLAEESIDDKSRFERSHFWCIDPLDGTLPFTEGHDGYSVSIALVSKSGQSKLGVVYDPKNDQLFTAIHEEGAYLNGEKISQDQTDDCCYFIHDRSLLKDPNYNALLNLHKTYINNHNLTSIKIVEHGGAAMNTCWTALKKHGCYIKLPKRQNGGGSIWDFAAGSLIASEAGCVVTDYYAHDLNLNNQETTYMNKGGVIITSNMDLWTHIKIESQKFIKK